MSRKQELARMGAEIARVRKDASLSQVALAEQLGVHRTTVARWETGRNPIDGGDLAKLEQLLGVRVVFRSAL